MSRLLSCLMLGAMLNAAPAFAADRPYIIGTSAQGSVAYTAGTAISKVADAKAGLTVRARATGGSSTATPQINSGQLDFGLSNALETGQAYLGIGQFNGRPTKNLRVAAAIFPLMTGFAVVANSKIKSLADAKGSRIPSEFTAQTTFKEITLTVLASAGLTPADFKGVPVPNYINGGQLLGQGKVDMALVAPNSGASRQLDAELKGSGGLRFVSMGDDLAGMRKVFAEAYPLKLAASKTTPGLDNGVTITAYPFYLITGTHVPEDVIYKIVKTVLHDNRQALIDTYASFKDFNEKDMARPHSSVPFHKGAVKFYKEAGIWQNGKM
jgi:TRAP transporter TAXI family solute receptor